MADTYVNSAQGRLKMNKIQSTYGEYRSARERARSSGEWSAVYDIAANMKIEQEKESALLDWWQEADMKKVSQEVAWHGLQGVDSPSLLAHDGDTWSMMSRKGGRLITCAGLGLDLNDMQIMWAFLPARSCLPIFERLIYEVEPEAIYHVRTALDACEAYWRAGSPASSHTELDMLATRARDSTKWAPVVSGAQSAANSAMQLINAASPIWRNNDQGIHQVARVTALHAAWAHARDIRYGIETPEAQRARMEERAEAGEFDNNAYMLEENKLDELHEESYQRWCKSFSYYVLEHIRAKKLNMPCPLTWDVTVPIEARKHPKPEV